MKYETIDQGQIKDIMEGREPQPPEDWDDPGDSLTKKTGKKAPAADGPVPIGGPASEH
jgi:cell division protease FtsH